MNRSFLLGAAAMWCVPRVALAQAVTGGGTATTQNTYNPEYGKFNPGHAKQQSQSATFSTYYAASSAIGQFAFLSDNLSCDINKGACKGKGGKPRGNTVSYAASDAVLSAAQEASWATSKFGQSAAGNLIQLPSMGVGVAIPIVNPDITANGQANLSDNDLCGVFSGAITDFSQITDSQAKLAPGPFQVVYATGAAGTSFWLTEHLAAVCDTGNSAITFAATSDFASLFPLGVPANFVGAAEGQGQASLLAGCSGTVALALGYVTPDYTTIDSSSGAMLNCNIDGGTKSPLVVAAIYNGTSGVTPTVASIATALTHVTIGEHLAPPKTPQQGADPDNWVPLISVAGAGYPIVGYTTFDFAQCYKDNTVATALKLFLPLHYGNGDYTAIEHANGFASLGDTSATGFQADILANMLADKNRWSTDIGDKAACAGKTGR